MQDRQAMAETFSRSFRRRVRRGRRAGGTPGAPQVESKRWRGGDRSPLLAGSRHARRGEAGAEKGQAARDHRGHPDAVQPGRRARRDLLIESGAAIRSYTRRTAGREITLAYWHSGNSWRFGKYSVVRACICGSGVAAANASVVQIPGKALRAAG